MELGRVSFSSIFQPDNQVKRGEGWPCRLRGRRVWSLSKDSWEEGEKE
jgi:hypothetical protein